VTTGAQRIRDAVAAGTVLMPGLYDALTARIAARVGFDVVFISGYSVSATRLGEPDFGFLTQTEMVDAARAVCRVSAAPVIVDADTGYGNAVNVLRTVRDLQDAGASGVFLEDQVWPKNCYRAYHGSSGGICPRQPRRRPARTALSRDAGGAHRLVCQGARPHGRDVRARAGRVRRQA
jgi:2-methylisocitrate lyase-like PEP mutase family enzyme